MADMKPSPPPNIGSLFPEQRVQVVLPARAEDIHTERLYLRPLELADAAAIFEYRSRQDVAEWLWPKTPHTDIKQTEAMIQKKVFSIPDASGATGRQFVFAIILADDPLRKVVGMVGINALVPAPSIGYGIHPDLWGKGYTSEAVRAVKDAWWRLPRAELELELEPGEGGAREAEQLFAACNQGNMGSVRVLQKSGFEIYREIPFTGDVVLLMSAKHPSWGVDILLPGDLVDSC